MEFFIKKLFYLSLITLTNPILPHIGKVTVLENTYGSYVVFYGDLHSPLSVDLPQNLQLEKINYVMPNIEKTLQLNDNVVILFEGLEPLEKREKQITHNGLFLLHLTKLYDKLIKTEDYNNIINIDNRDFIFNEIYDYVNLKELLNSAEENGNEEIKSYCLTQLKDQCYNSFKDQDLNDLYNSLYKMLRMVFIKLRNEYQEYNKKCDFLDEMFENISKDIKKFKEK